MYDIMILHQILQVWIMLQIPRSETSSNNPYRNANAQGAARFVAIICNGATVLESLISRTFFHLII